jgi:hypothetical protein
MTAPRHVGRQQWVPGKGQDPVLRLPGTTQHIQQDKDTRHLAHYECHSQRKGRLVNGGHGAEEQLRPRRIGARDIRIVQRAGLGCVQPVESTVARDEDIRVMAEPLHAAIPHIPANVIVWTRWHSQEWNVPQSRQHEPKDDDVLRDLRRGQDLAEREEVRNASDDQRNDE